MFTGVYTLSSFFKKRTVLHLAESVKTNAGWNRIKTSVASVNPALCKRHRTITLPFLISLKFTVRTRLEKPSLGLVHARRPEP